MRPVPEESGLRLAESVFSGGGQFFTYRLGSQGYTKNFWVSNFFLGKFFLWKTLWITVDRVLFQGVCSICSKIEKRLEQDFFNRIKDLGGFVPMFQCSKIGYKDWQGGVHAASFVKK